MNARTDNLHPATPVPPFRLMQDDLGLNGEDAPLIRFADRNGVVWDTKDIEQVLYHIDHFVGRGRISLLAGAALHYGLDGYALMGREPADTQKRRYDHG
jgi:hypothetical protein